MIVLYICYASMTPWSCISRTGCLCISILCTRDTRYEVLVMQNKDSCKEVVMQNKDKEMKHDFKTLLTAC